MNVNMQTRNETVMWCAAL